MKRSKEKWKVKKSKLLYKDSWIRLRLDSVKRPNGFVSDYSVVELKGGIGVVPLDKDGKFYIVGQYRYPADVYSWEIPKGAFDSFMSEESPLERAKQELVEETGIIAKEWKEITTVHTLLGSTNDKVFLFLARNLTIDQPHREKREIIQMQKVSFKEFYEMIKRQEVTDATSIAAVVLAEKLLLGDRG